MHKYRLPSKRNAILHRCFQACYLGSMLHRSKETANTHHKRLRNGPAGDDMTRNTEHTLSSPPHAISSYNTGSTGSKGDLKRGGERRTSTRLGEVEPRRTASTSLCRLGQLNWPHGLGTQQTRTRISAAGVGILFLELNSRFLDCMQKERRFQTKTASPASFPRTRIP